LKFAIHVVPVQNKALTAFNGVLVNGVLDDIQPYVILSLLNETLGLRLLCFFLLLILIAALETLPAAARGLVRSNTPRVVVSLGFLV
jgi:hypothetical protein